MSLSNMLILHDLVKWTADYRLFRKQNKPPAVLDDTKLSIGAIGKGFWSEKDLSLARLPRDI
jgi:hypothetical protein